MSGAYRAAAAVRTFWSGLVDLVLPDVCGGCGRGEAGEDGLCDACGVELLRLVSLPYCPRCGATLGPNVPAYPGGCASCPNPLPRPRRVFRLGPYSSLLRQAVRELKYRGRDGLARRLCRLLGEVVSAGCDKEHIDLDLVVPIPMHWLRRLRRGANHAQLLAENLAEKLYLPAGRELIRIRNTPPQVRMNRTERIANVRGAFRVASRSAIRGARVLLVDDVTTSGATANEATRALLKGGASSVALAVIAKAEPPRAYTQQWE